MVELEDLNEEISTVIRVLKRSRRPVREDLEVLSQEKWSQFFPFASVMEAEGFLDNYYSKDSANDKVDRLAYGLSLMALTKYRETYLSKLADWERIASQTHIESLIKEERYIRLEKYLSDLAVDGYKKASANLRNPERGLKFQYLTIGFFSVLELAVGLLILSACERGFQVLVISSLAMIYARIMTTILESSNSSSRRFALTFLGLTRIRRLLHDSLLDISFIDEDQDEMERVLHRDRVSYYILYSKYSLIELIVGIEIFRTVF